MKKNLGQVDRVARIFVGAVILIVAAQFGSWWGLLGLALMITGAVGYCGLYQLLGIDTLGKQATPTAGAGSDQNQQQQPPAAPQQ